MRYLRLHHARSLDHLGAAMSIRYVQVSVR
jgi:hypothetical protein